MNVVSTRLAKCSDKPGSAARAALLASLALAPLLLAVSPPGQAQDSPPIVASLNAPPAGLACEVAAAATSVYFQFTNPPFQVSQISLYLDGRGVPEEAVNEQWPTVTLNRGLHPGSNTIDIVASGGAGQQIQRRMVVQVGGMSDGSAGQPQVRCDDSATAPPQEMADQAPAGMAGAEPQPMAVPDSPPPLDAMPPPDDGYPPPVYLYSAYPAVAFGSWVPLAPFFRFGLFYASYHPHFAPPHQARGTPRNGYGFGSPRLVEPRLAPRYVGPSYSTVYSAPVRQYRPVPQYRPAPQYRPIQAYRQAHPPSFHASAFAARAGGGRSVPLSHGGERRR